MKKNILFTFISNIVALAVSLIVFKPFFEELDDTLTAMVSEGAFGLRDAHLPYSNYFLGVIEKALQTIIPQIRWHSVLEYMFIFFALCLVVYVLCHYEYGKLLSVALLMGCSYELYVALQFTKIPAAISGCVLIAFLLLVRDYWKNDGLLFSKKERWIIGIVGIILFIYACWLRYEPVAIAICLIGPVGVCTFVRCIANREQRRKWKTYVSCFVPLLIILLLSVITENYYLTADPMWKEYTEYNSARMLWVDNRYDAFDYGANSETLDAVGVSENDALMYLTYMFPDVEEISVEDMWAIVEAQPPKDIGIKLFKEWIRNLYDTYCVLNASILLTVILTAAILIRYKKSYFPELIMMGSSLAVVLFYFQYSGRWNHRLAYSAVLVELLTLIYLLVSEKSVDDSDNVINQAIFGTAMGLLIFGNCGHLLGNIFDYNAYMRTRISVDYSILQEHVEENKDILFCADTFTLQDVFKYDVFKPTHVGQCENVVACGSGITHSPIVREQTGKYGYDNVVKALYSMNENVRLIDNRAAKEKTLYLTEHGDGEIYESILVDTVGGYNIYRIDTPSD